MTLIAQTFAPAKSRIGRYDETVATYQVLNQIGTPLVKRTVTSTGDNITQRSYLLKNIKIDRQPWEPYFYSTQLGLSVRKITLTDPSLRIYPIKILRFDDNNEPYAVINQIGVPAVKRVVADNSNRITPIKILRFDDNNEPYAVINQVGNPSVKRVVADNSNRIIPIKITRFDDVNEPYAVINQLGAPPAKRVVADNASRIIPTKITRYDEIAYISYNWYNDIVRTGIGTKPSSAGTTGIDGTSQRSTSKIKPIYGIISYMSYNYWNDIYQAGLSTIEGTGGYGFTGLNPSSWDTYAVPYVKTVTGVKGTTGIDGTTLAPVNVNETTSFSISNAPYFYPYQIGAPVVQTRNIDAGQSSVSSRNIRYDQSIRAIYHDPPYQIGLPTPYKTTVSYSSAPVEINVLKYYPRTIEGPYYTMNKVGLAVGVSGVSNYQFWS